MLFVAVLGATDVSTQDHTLQPSVTRGQDIAPWLARQIRDGELPDAWESGAHHTTMQAKLNAASALWASCIDDGSESEPLCEMELPANQEHISGTEISRDRVLSMRREFKQLNCSGYYGAGEKPWYGERTYEQPVPPLECDRLLEQYYPHPGLQCLFAFIHVLYMDVHDAGRAIGRISSRADWQLAVNASLAYHDDINHGFWIEATGTTIANDGATSPETAVWDAMYDLCGKHFETAPSWRGWQLESQSAVSCGHGVGHGLALMTIPRFVRAFSRAGSGSRAVSVMSVEDAASICVNPDAGNRDVGAGLRSIITLNCLIGLVMELQNIALLDGLETMGDGGRNRPNTTSIPAGQTLDDGRRCMLLPLEARGVGCFVEAPVASCAELATPLRQLVSDNQLMDGCDYASELALSGGVTQSVCLGLPMESRTFCIYSQAYERFAQKVIGAAGHPTEAPGVPNGGGGTSDAPPPKPTSDSVSMGDYFDGYVESQDTTDIDDVCADGGSACIAMMRVCLDEHYWGELASANVLACVGGVMSGMAFYADFNFGDDVLEERITSFCQLHERLGATLQEVCAISAVFYGGATHALELAVTGQLEWQLTNENGKLQGTPHPQVDFAI